MPYFSNVKDLVKHLQQNVIPDVMGKEVYDVVVAKESEHVQTDVYDKYNEKYEDGSREPFVYKRRGKSGGLADPANHIAPFFYKGINSVEMLIQNTTKNKDGKMYTAETVEYGRGYDYDYNRKGTAWKYLQKRPFMHNTVLELRKTLDHVEAFRRGLKRHNIKTY